MWSRLCSNVLWTITYIVHKTADGKLCSENGFSVVDDLTACKKAAGAFDDQFIGTEDVSDWPKGCYYSDGVYFNQHDSGSANIDAAQICNVYGKLNVY